MSSFSAMLLRGCASPSSCLRSQILLKCNEPLGTVTRSYSFKEERAKANTGADGQEQQEQQQQRRPRRQLSQTAVRLTRRTTMPHDDPATVPTSQASERTKKERRRGRKKEIGSNTTSTGTSSTTSASHRRRQGSGDKESNRSIPYRKVPPTQKSPSRAGAGQHKCEQKEEESHPSTTAAEDIVSSTERRESGESQVSYVTELEHHLSVSFHGSLNQIGEDPTQSDEETMSRGTGTTGASTKTRDQNEEEEKSIDPADESSNLTESKRGLGANGGLHSYGHKRTKKNRKVTLLPPNWESLSRTEIVSLLRRVANERDELNKKNPLSPTSSAPPKETVPYPEDISPATSSTMYNSESTLSSTSSLLNSLHPTCVTFDIDAFKKRLYITASSMIKHACHGRLKKPWIEFSEFLPLTAAHLVFEGFASPVEEIVSPRRDVQQRHQQQLRYIKWQLFEHEIARWLKCNPYIHRVKFVGKKWFLAGNSKDVYAWAGFDTCHLCLDKSTEILTVKIRTFVAGYGRPKPGTNTPPSLA